MASTQLQGSLIVCFVTYVVLKSELNKSSHVSFQLFFQGGWPKRSLLHPDFTRRVTTTSCHKPCLWIWHKICLSAFSERHFCDPDRREVFFPPISPGGSQPPAATSRAFGFGTKYACLLFPKGIFVNHLLEKKVDKTYCMCV